MAVSNVKGSDAAKQLYGASQTNAAQPTKKTAEYGKTVGKPELSEEGKKYYEQLKKKYGNLDFVLVSRDQKENAKANAAKYANPHKMVVLIDEDKIERMATDADYRKQYESVIANAGSNLAQMKSQLAGTGANVKGFGMEVKEDGTTSMFAVLKKSSSDQKARIEKKREKVHAEKKAAEKKAAKKEQEKRIERAKASKAEQVNGDEEDVEDEDTIVITADSMEELLSKISDFMQNEKMNTVQTPEEQMVGQHIDFRG